MLLPGAVASVVAEGAYAPAATYLSGSSEYFYKSTALTGASDNKLWTFSCWVKPETNSNEQMIFGLGPNGSNYMRVSLSADAQDLGIYARLSNNFAFAKAIPDVVTASSWNHIIFSFDASDDSKCHLYVNDTDADANPYVSGNYNVNHDGIPIRIGALSYSATWYYKGCLTELWHDSTYIDLSVESNRRKWIDASGKPVDLGSDGSTPTASSPLVYMTGNATAFPTNHGSGGTPFSVNGTPDNCSDGPSS